MAEVLQFGQRGRKPIKIDPDLKGFIDRVIVPILVQSYLAELQNEKQVAEGAAMVASCRLRTNSPQAGISR